MKTVGCLSLVALFASLPEIWCWNDRRFSNSSAVTPATITPAPIHCGGCTFFYEVHAHVWWPIIYTDYIATIVYTVERESGATIGSQLQYSNTTTTIGEGVNFTSVASAANGYGIEYTTLNSITDAEMATIIQSNEVTMNGTNNGYLFGTQFINSSLTGTAMTQCASTFYLVNPTNTTIPPYLPASTGYLYTTVVPFDSTYNMSDALVYGLDVFASYIATELDLTVPACTSYTGGGIGTLKVGVTALTSSATVYAAAETISSTATTPSPTPTASPTTPTPTSTLASPSIPSSTNSSEEPLSTYSSELPTSTNTFETSALTSPTTELPDTSAPSVNLLLPLTSSESQSPQTSSEPNGGVTTTIVITTSGPEGLSTITETSTLGPSSYITESFTGSSSIGSGELSPGEVSTIVYTTSGPSGLETLNSIVTSPLSSFTTTLVYTTSGSSGLETISEVVISSISSFITTLVYTTSGPSGLQTISEVVTLPLESEPYTTTNILTTSGPSGEQTISETITVPSLGAVILSIAGITVSSESGGATTTSSTTTSSSTQTGSEPAGFTGSGSKPIARSSLWVVQLILFLIMFVI